MILVDLQSEKIGAPHSSVLICIGGGR